ncbi:MAG: amidohydrolase family protein, partial [Bacteroidota bacterium]
GKYAQAPSGLPLIQHPVLMMFEAAREGRISRAKVVEKMCHNPAISFRVRERGFIREGYWADLVLIDPNARTEVTRESLLYKCGWSPLEGTVFSHCIHSTFVNGVHVWQNGVLSGERGGMRLGFEGR